MRDGACEVRDGELGHDPAVTRTLDTRHQVTCNLSFVAASAPLHARGLRQRHHPNGADRALHGRVTLDSASFGERTATIAVNDRSGQPAAVDQVVLAPVMEAMGMASPELTALPTAPGRYQVKGEFFSMIGEWQVNVRVSAAGKDDLARFLFQVQP